MKIRQILGFGLTVIGGFTLGFSFGQDFEHEKAQKLSDQEISEMKAHYDEKLRAYILENGSKNDEKTEENEGETFKRVNPLAKIETDEHKDGKRIAYNDIFKPSIDDVAKKYSDENFDPRYGLGIMYKNSEENLEDGLTEEEIDMIRDIKEGEYLAERQKNDERLHPEPYFIQEEEYYGDEYANYDRIELTYWCLDEAFTDDRDELIENPDNVLGKSCVGEIKIAEVGNIFYVRNHRQEADYEVMVVGKSYTGNVVVGDPDFDEIYDEEGENSGKPEPIKRRKDRPE